MSENRFKSTLDEDTMSVMPYLVSDNEECFYNLQDCVDLLNEQQTEIMELRSAIDYLKTVIRYTIPNEMVADVFKQIGEEYE